jgi:hypothetical protein
VSKNGIDGDGQFTAGLAAVLGLMFLVVNSRRGYVVGMIVAAIAAAIGLYDYIDVDSAVGDLDADSEGLASASMGIGVYGTVLGAFGGFFTALGARRALTGDTAALPPPSG